MAQVPKNCTTCEHLCREKVGGRMEYATCNKVGRYAVARQADMKTFECEDWQPRIGCLRRLWSFFFGYRNESKQPCVVGSDAMASSPKTKGTI